MAVIDGKDVPQTGRTLARLEVDGKDVAVAMVAVGMAWHAVRYSDEEQLARADREARAAGRGLKADHQSVPPWEWRASQRLR